MTTTDPTPLPPGQRRIRLVPEPGDTPEVAIARLRGVGPYWREAFRRPERAAIEREHQRVTETYS